MGQRTYSGKEGIVSQLGEIGAGPVGALDIDVLRKLETAWLRVRVHGQKKET
jgi:hypothetical protein